MSSATFLIKDFSGRCLTVTDHNIYSGRGLHVQVVLKPPFGNDHQQGNEKQLWKFASARMNSIISTGPNFQLECYLGGWLYTDYSGGSASPNDEYYVKIRFRGTSICLQNNNDMVLESRYDAATKEWGVVVMPYVGSKEQSWSLEYVDNPTGRVRLAAGIYDY